MCCSLFDVHQGLECVLSIFAHFAAFVQGRDPLLLYGSRVIIMDFKSEFENEDSVFGIAADIEEEAVDPSTASPGRVRGRGRGRGSAAKAAARGAGRGGPCLIFYRLLLLSLQMYLSLSALLSS